MSPPEEKDVVVVVSFLPSLRAGRRKKTRTGCGIRRRKLLVMFTSCCHCIAKMLQILLLSKYLVETLPSDGGGDPGGRRGTQSLLLRHNDRGERETLLPLPCMPSLFPPPPPPPLRPSLPACNEKGATDSDEKGKGGKNERNDGGGGGGGGGEDPPGHTVAEDNGPRKKGADDDDDDDDAHAAAHRYISGKGKKI